MVQCIYWIDGERIRKILKEDPSEGSARNHMICLKDFSLFIAKERERDKCDNTIVLVHC